MTNALVQTALQSDLIAKARRRDHQRRASQANAPHSRQNSECRRNNYVAVRPNDVSPIFFHQAPQLARPSCCQKAMIGLENRQFQNTGKSIAALAVIECCKAALRYENNGCNSRDRDQATHDDAYAIARSSAMTVPLTCSVSGTLH
jgi:hypothetical protein